MSGGTSGDQFPQRRMRRLRTTGAMRRLVNETSLEPRHLVAPLFVGEGLTEPEPIASLEGHDRHSLDSLAREVKHLAGLGIGGVILFGVPEAHTKDAEGSGAWAEDGITQVALRATREAIGDELVVMADLCLDEWTTHGHCGVLDAAGRVTNDATIERYGRVGASQAQAGADVVAPSGMMDGQVAAIRAALDAGGHPTTAILSYAAKFASAFYGPFRDAVGVELAGDRRTYQEDPGNSREALAEVALDVAEGADMVMVKPAGPYLDVVAAVRASTTVPVGAYQVSGEFAMVKAAARMGWLTEAVAALELLTSVRRAGADFVLTYFAGAVAEALSH